MPTQIAVFNYVVQNVIDIFKTQVERFLFAFPTTLTSEGMKTNEPRTGPSLVKIAIKNGYENGAYLDSMVYAV